MSSADPAGVLLARGAVLVLSIGLEQHIISTGLFSLMIEMAVVTTLLTGPALNRLGDGDRRPLATAA